MNFINPKIKDVLKENENTTVLGLFWAGYWRFMIAFFVIWCAFWFMVGFLGLL